MKKVYCIEVWARGSELSERPVNDVDVTSKDYLSSLEYPYKNGFPVLEEYDDEERFKTDLKNLINGNCVISRVYIKDVRDDYRPAMKIC